MAFNKTVSLLIRVCMTLTSASSASEIEIRTIKELILLTEDTSNAVHKIAAQAKSQRLVPIREEYTCSRNIDSKDISLLKLFQSRFGS